MHGFQPVLFGCPLMTSLCPLCPEASINLKLKPTLQLLQHHAESFPHEYHCCLLWNTMGYIY